MEMWLWHLVILLTVAGMVLSAPIIVTVNETSGKKVILEGSSVILHCSLWTDIPERYRVFWNFNPNRPSDSGSQNLSEHMCNENMTKAAHLNKDDDRKTLDTYKMVASQNNTGWYSCRANAEIPFYRSNNSNWTQIVVNNSLMEHATTQTVIIEEETANSSVWLWDDWWMWVALAGSCLILGILLLVCFVLRKRQLRNRALECAVYANMPRVNRQPSPQPRSLNNNLKTDASYQNLQTPKLGMRYEHGRRPH